MIRVLTLFTVVVAGSPAAAAADKTPLQKETRSYGLELPVPGDYCELTPAHPVDRDMLATAEQLNAGYNRVLSIAADCGQLDAMRSKGTALSNYATYLMPMSAGDEPLRMSRAQVVAALADAFVESDPVGTAEDTLRNRFDEADMAIELQDLVGLGLLHRDDTAVFTGVLTRMAIDDAAPEVTAVVSGMTLINGRIVSVNLSAPYDGQRTVDDLLEQQRRNVQALIDAN